MFTLCCPASDHPGKMWIFFVDLQNNFGLPEWCGKPKSLHRGEATFGRTAKANIFSSYRLSRPIIILFVAEPPIWGQRRKQRLVKKSKWQMDCRTKQLVVSAIASAGKTFKVLLEHSSKKTCYSEICGHLNNFSQHFVQLSANFIEFLKLLQSQF